MLYKKEGGGKELFEAAVRAGWTESLGDCLLAFVRKILSGENGRVMAEKEE